jgi:hypothetical protein
MLRYGVPEPRLPRIVLDAEIDVVRRMGAAFRCSVRVGRDVSLDGLRREFGKSLSWARCRTPELLVRPPAPRASKGSRQPRHASPGVFAGGGDGPACMTVRASRICDHGRLDRPISPAGLSRATQAVHRPYRQLPRGEIDRFLHEARRPRTYPAWRPAFVGMCPSLEDAPPSPGSAASTATPQG